MKSDFIQHLKRNFPGLQNEPLEDLVAENLISPFAIKVPQSILSQAQRFIEIIFSLRQKASYLDHYKSLIHEKNLQDPGNKSIMMSYDFHVDENNQLKLIEVNTNAAFLILGYEMYRMKGHPLPVSDFAANEIAMDIQNELHLQSKTFSSPPKVAIVDENPSAQRLFVEFLVYNELFKSWGWDSRILDYRELFKEFSPDFIYNRWTDFFLTDSSSAPLRQKFLDKSVCLSPNPFEYLLLADKQRMIDWVKPGFLESQGLANQDRDFLLQCLPGSYDLTAANAEEIWGQRKKLFFKPKNAFGSKQSFRGSSISRKAYDELLQQDVIAQEFIPAPEQSFETPEGDQRFKYDLRCYAYQGRLQLIVARIYQGQVTNLRTPYGGFATVLLSN